MHLTLDPPFAPLHAALIAILVAGAAFWLYIRPALETNGMRRAVLGSIRILVVAVLTLILLNPVVVVGRPQSKQKPPLLILMDTSASMATADGENGLTRFEEAKRNVVGNRQLMEGLSRKSSVRVFSFAESVAALNAADLAAMKAPKGEQTDIGKAMAGAPGTTSKGGQILLVSDGRDTAESYPLDAARSLRALGYTISTYCIGKKTERRDVQVIARKEQVVAAPGQTVQIAAEVRDEGIPRTRLNVDLMEDGLRVQRKSISVEPGRREISFDVFKSRKGNYRFAIQAENAGEERDVTNNRADVALDVMDTKAKVLLLEGRPSWDSKFLAQALRSDPTVSLDVVYKLTDDKFFAVMAEGGKDSGIQLPRTVDQLGRYDVVMLGKGFEEFYDAAAAKALLTWVSERGGNVLFLRGRTEERTNLLHDIEPVNWSDQEVEELRIRLTQEGRTYPGFSGLGSQQHEDVQAVVKKLPPLISSSYVQGEKAISVVLARAEGENGDGDKAMATVATMRYGHGKSMAIASQGLWRWAFLPPDMEGYGKVYQEFWSQTVRWMVSGSDFLPGSSIAIRSDRSTYALKDTVNLLGSLRGGMSVPNAVQLTLPDGSKSQIGVSRSDGKLADFTATYHPLQTGSYLASVRNGGGSPATARFTVQANNQEEVNTSADPELMRQLASAGGGAALTSENINSFPDRLSSLEQTTTKKAEPVSAWDRPWLLAGLLVALASEWLLRRRWGMT